MVEYNKLNNDNKIPLVVVVGPTASGKTKLGIEICKKYNGEVISADSMQIYKNMNIATAKPSVEEMQGIKHHLIDFLDINQEFSVANYVDLAKQKITEVYNRNKLPVIVGGTGLYINSLLENVNFGDIKIDNQRKAELEEQAKYNQKDLHELLSKYDPDLASELHENNTTRIIRGILVFEATGKTLTQYKKESKQIPSKYKSCVIGLTCEDRQKLYDRVNMRVDIMINDGLIEEARHFYQMDLCKNQVSRTAKAAIGYKELYGYIMGEKSLEESVENLKRETRRYAKRQLTWFRRNEQINWIYTDKYKSFDDIFDVSESIINKNIFS